PTDGVFLSRHALCEGRERGHGSHCYSPPHARWLTHTHTHTHTHTLAYPTPLLPQLSQSGVLRRDRSSLVTSDKSGFIASAGPGGAADANARTHTHTHTNTHEQGEQHKCLPSLGSCQ